MKMKIAKINNFRPSNNYIKKHKNKKVKYKS